jgi:large subunit ribosomal protein L13
MKTYSPRPGDVQRAWYVIDAENEVLGRLASEVAQILRGKHKPTYAPHMDMGDHVVVINADKIRLTGQKADQKVYQHHSGYPGGLRTVPYGREKSRRPDRVIERAVRGMLPHTRLGRSMLRKLSVYAGAEHPHQAQRPVPLRLGTPPSRASAEAASEES